MRPKPPNSTGILRSNPKAGGRLLLIRSIIRRNQSLLDLNLRSLCFKQEIPKAERDVQLFAFFSSHHTSADQGGNKEVRNAGLEEGVYYTM
jgi:hypothetical protein